VQLIKTHETLALSTKWPTYKSFLSFVLEVKYFHLKYITQNYLINFVIGITMMCVCWIPSPERGAGLFLKCGAHSTSSRPCCCKGPWVLHLIQLYGHLRVTYRPKLYIGATTVCHVVHLLSSLIG